ncbi:MAG: hypothetical protein HY204_04180 [Nitrospirae bacterium]|nr:hypothetical protein [Nitrospirota bacterium]
MNRFNATVRYVFVASMLLLTACPGRGGEGAATAVIDSAGGTLTGPDGVQVVVPAGALDQPTEIGIARKSEGAPAALEAYPVASNIYELTPHDLLFNLPVTIRMPVRGGASGSVFMASPGQDWNVKNATVVNGVAEWDLGSFSWMYWSAWQYEGHGAGRSCSIPTSMLNDPYWCGLPGIGASLSATPPQALTQTPVYPYHYFGRVDQAATLHFQSQVYVPGNCGNVTVELRRRRWNESTMTWGPPQTISTQHPALTVDGSDLSGTAAFDLPFTYQDNGKNDFKWDLSTDCPGVLLDARGDVVGWDYSNYSSDGAFVTTRVEGNIVPLNGIYTVGGSVTGLTGTGLVLQNNSVDNLAVTTNGSFTFATTIPDNTPYSVSVQTQPSGQFCTVQNGSGTALTNVSNVAVSCGLALAISPINASATDTLCFGGINSTVTFTASDGTPPYYWSASVNGLTVINATQAQWSDTTERFCDWSGGVIVNVTDSTGASASARIQVN